MFSLFWICLLPAWQSFDEVVAQPVDQTTWQVSTEVRRSEDAIVLIDHARLTSTHIDRFRRVLILNELGKSAAEFNDIGGRVKNLKGRVITRSGQTSEFNQKDDLIEVLAAKTRRSKSRARFLVPPGLTNDCIVDMSWRISADSGIPSGQNFWRHEILEPFHCSRKVVEISKTALRGTSSGIVSQFVWANGGDAITFKKSERRGTTYLTYENVPARQAFPFGNRFYDSNPAFFLAFRTFPSFGDKPEQFWRNFAKDGLHAIYQFRFNGSRAYDAWIKELKATRSEDPVDALLEVYDAFRKKIAHVDLMPPSVKAKMASNEEENDAGMRMNKVFDQGYGYDDDISRLFFHTLRDLDIPAKMVFSTPTWQGAFNPAAMNWFSLQIYKPMFGFPQEGGGWLLVMPSSPAYSPGFVPSSFLTGQALVVDPANKWKHDFTVLNRFQASDHRRLRQYKTTFEVKDDVGTMGFTVNERGTGAFNARFKHWFYEFPADEHANRLTKIWERRASNYQIEQAKVVNGEILSGTVTMTVSGTRQLEADGNQWFSIYPFPGDTIPLDIPDYWPEDRTQPVFLPHQLTQTDINQITVPVGWAFRGKPSWRKSNDIGQVSFAVGQKDQVITIRRDITIHADALRPDAEPALKAFIAWMEEAWFQALGLEKGDAS